MKVTVDGLNFRSAPVMGDEYILNKLPLAQTVTVINGPADQRFWEVETTINGVLQRGYASPTYLRPEESDLKERLIESAAKEWFFFKRGSGQEYDSPFYERIGEYWQRIGENYDGRDRDAYWSAVFISFIHWRAGFNDFKFSAGHAKYICDAKRKRENGVDGPYWLFRLNEHKPKLGDLICGWRDRSKTYETVPTPANYNHDTHFFPSHTDVIVEVNNSYVRTLGGNVEQSVWLKTFPLLSTGYLRPEGKMFGIMRNNR